MNKTFPFFLGEHPTQQSSDIAISEISFLDKFHSKTKVSQIQNFGESKNERNAIN
jgi:hypothetical protein